MDMKVLFAMLLVSAFGFSLPVAEVTPHPFSQVQEHLKPVPGDTPELLFASTITRRAKQAGPVALKNKHLPADGLEFRVWVGFGKKPLEGFIVSRLGNSRQATFLESINQTTHPPYRKQFSEAKSGWAQFWNQLLAEHLLSLPDRAQLKDEERLFDGTSYVVDLKENLTYRTYAYMNPDYQKWPEARRMVKIAKILYSEFGIKR
jgi:hypothetical protein